MKVTVLAALFLCATTSLALADKCTDDATALGKQFGAKAGRNANDMVPLSATGFSEIVFGCDQGSGAFLVMYAEPRQNANSFIDAVSRAGSAFTRQSANDIRRSAAKCLEDARVTGSARLEGPKLSFDCDAGGGGLNAKVTIERH